MNKQTTERSRAVDMHVAIRSQRRAAVDLGEMWRQRELLYFFVWREVKVRYKQSVVGIGWAVLQPLAMMVVFTIFFGQLAKIGSNGIPHPLFYYAGLVPWTFFQTSVNAATNSLVNNSALVTKVYFPRPLLPIASVLSGLVDFGLAFVVLLGLESFYVVRGTPGVHLSVTLLLIPFLVALLIITAVAAGLWLAVLNARYRDLRYAVPFVLQFLMFLSPVVYPASRVPERWQWLYALNPLSGIIEGFRWALTRTGDPRGVMLAISSGMVVLALFAGLRYFRKWEGTVADVI
jgi:lipopolysaccharide transport system permease protein